MVVVNRTLAELLGVLHRVLHTKWRRRATGLDVRIVVTALNRDHQRSSISTFSLNTVGSSNLWDCVWIDNRTNGGISDWLWFDCDGFGGLVWR